MVIRTLSVRSKATSASNKNNVETEEKSTWSKFKWIIVSIIILLVVVAAVLLIIFLIVKPSAKSSQQTPPLINFNYGPPDLTSNPTNLGSYDDNAQSNSNTPKLVENFPYRQSPVRGVNLGGWLVLEPFITPSLFEKFDSSENIVDEWSMCAKLGRSECRKVLEKHYNEFLTEDDMKKIAAAGLNHVRIPVGYWAIDIDETKEPFVYGSWHYLLRGIQWARKYGIRVMVEFHGAPGSQNGWNHSGRFGKIKFLNSTDPNSPQNVARFNTILKNTVNFFKQPQWSNVVTMFGVLNEPAIFLTKNDVGVKQWYKDSYNALRPNNSTDGPLLVFHEGFLGIDKWAGAMPNSTYKKITLDTHNYLIFDKDLVRLPLQDQVSLPCKSWKSQFIQSDKNFGWTMCGEFSVATNDCGYWLNGVGLGSRFDGTYQLEPGPPACDSCTCKDDASYKKFSNDKKQLLLKFMELQMDAFETSLGWFFWNFKTENHVNPFWDYFLALDEGWAPKDASKRTYKC